MSPDLVNLRREFRGNQDFKNSLFFRHKNGFGKNSGVNLKNFELLNACVMVTASHKRNFIDYLRVSI